MWNSLKNAGPPDTVNLTHGSHSEARMFVGRLLRSVLKKVFRDVYNRKHTRIAAVVMAAIIGLVTLGGELRWTAFADTGDTDPKTDIPQPTVDLDSLYAAKTSEREGQDSSFIQFLNPTKAFDGHVSWYGSRFHGRRTANGERFDMNRMTAAHKTLPFNTLVRVVDKETGSAVLVRVNDRGPYVRGRVLDLSKKAAGRLGMKSAGTTNARLEIFAETTLVEEDAIIRTASDKKEKVSSDPVTYITFDSKLTGAHPNGWSVQVGSFELFDDAADLHHELLNEYDEVFLTRVVQGGEMVYTVSVGLANSLVLGRNILVEVVGRHEEAKVVRFRNGYPTPEAEEVEVVATKS